MPVEMFLKVDGVTGGSKNYSHKGWSDVSSWAWVMDSNRDPTNIKETGRTAFGEIAITKLIGMDSPAIMLLYAQGKTIASAELTIIPIVAKREASQKYLAMRMEDVLIKSIVTGGNSSEEFFSETLTLFFSRIRFEYTFNAAPGIDPSGDSTAYSFAWDIRQNKEWQA